MRPMLPQDAIHLQQRLKRVGAIGLATAPQDHVMRALNRVYAVHLNKADAVDQTGQNHAVNRASGGLGQRVAMQEQTAGKEVWQNHGSRRGHHTEPQTQ